MDGWMKVGDAYLNPALVRQIIMNDDGASAEIVYTDDTSEYVRDRQALAQIAFLIGKR